MIRKELCTLPVSLLLLLSCIKTFSQDLGFDGPNAGNPIIPGYFADPTIKKFGDTYYLYATTDGNGFGFGPSQVWTSKDFVNWGIQPMNWPTTPIYWAPDIAQGYDDRYYLYYSQPVEIYGAASDYPTGPWTPLLADGQAVIPNHFVPNVITLDGQTFKDDDGKIYMFWGTWGIYPNSGCGMGLLNTDMKSFAKTGMIPNTVAKDFFEAPVMFKRDGIYYLLYSAEHCEDESYKVHYVMSKEGPMGPFTYGENNPILVTNADGTVHGPGHNGILQEGNEVYIVYHRHNNPHNQGGFHRQVAADKLAFDAQGNILKVIPTHNGIGALAPNTVPYENKAFGKTASASSYYSEEFRPAFAIDDNNGTLWKAADNGQDAWIQVDLGSVQRVRSILTQFEYATWYYQYRILYSTDGDHWETFADQWDNRQFGSPMKDYNDVQARFVRVLIGQTQVAGLNKAIWNLKVYAEAGVGRDLGKLSDNQADLPLAEGAKGLLLDVDADGFEVGEVVEVWKNQGTLGGELHNVGSSKPYVMQLAGKKALWFDGNVSLSSTFGVPRTLSGNSSFTVALWAYNPDVGKRETLVNWANGSRDLMSASLGFGLDKQEGGAVHGGWANLPYKTIPEEKKWHHIALTFDGTSEYLYVDGEVQNEGIHRMLFLKDGNAITIGNDEQGRHPFSGAMAGVKIYGKALSAAEVGRLVQEGTESPYALYFHAGDHYYGHVTALPNEGHLLGDLLIPGGAEIVDEGGRIALALKNGEELIWPDSLLGKWSPMPDFTLVAGILVPKAIKPLLTETKQWQHVAIVKSNDLLTYYVNGKKVSETAFMALQEGLRASLLDDKLRSPLFLSELYLLGEAVDAEKLAQYASQWQEQRQAPWPPAAEIVFSERSRAVNERSAYLEVELPEANSGGYRYLFEIVDDTLRTDWLDKPWHYMEGLTPNRDYLARFKLKDRFGNVSPYGKTMKISTRNHHFSYFHDGFDKRYDYVQEGVKDSGWDGLEGAGADSVQLLVDEKGLLLASAKTAWDGQGTKGPFLYKEIAGDFLVEVEVGDMSGLGNRKAIGANEIGLMVRAANGAVPQGETLLQSGVMLGWGVGNIVTALSRGRRAQQTLGSGWDFYPYLQIQRSGNTFFVRGSKEGKNWSELPGSPYVLPGLAGAPVQVGIYHSRYGDDAGFGRFGGFRLYQP